MKTKILSIAKKYPVIFSMITAVVWTGLLAGAGSLLYLVFPSIIDVGEYLGQGIVEVIGTLFGIAAISFLGYQSIYKEKKYGFGKSILVSGYLLVISVFTMVYGIMSTTSHTLLPAWQILIFIVTMFLIGTTEEFAFRGVISNLIFEKYGDSPAGIWFSTIISGVIFGCMHLPNAIAPEISFVSALVQGILASGLGMILVVIYQRTRNIWWVVFLHGLIDFAGLLPSGLFGSTTLASTINSYSGINLIALMPYAIVLLIILRKSKVNEMLAGKEVVPSKSAKRRLIITITIFCFVALAAFVTGVVHMAGMYMSQGVPVVSMSGSYYGMDAHENITIKAEGNYNITTTASDLTESCIVDFVIQDAQGNVYSQNTTGGGSSQMADVHLAAGTYIYEATLITTDSEFEQYMSEKNYDYDEATRQMYLDMLEENEDSSRGGTLGLEISMSVK